MEYVLLSEVASYSKLRTRKIDLNSYVSTENMLPNKKGVILASSIPSVSSASKYEVGDILLSNIRPYFCKIWQADKTGSCSNDVLIVKANDSIDSKFLYYVLSDQNFFNYDTTTSKGTKMPRGNKRAIMKYLVPYVPSDNQRLIASILSTYDTLIENNTKRIRLLEKMAENLYKEWFVRFRFPGHENVEMENGLPKGWKYCRLSKVSEYSNSKISSKLVSFYVSTENMMKDFGGIDQNVPSRPIEGSSTKVEIGNILISNIRPYFKKIWFADKEAACSNDVLNIKAKDGIPPMFLYHSLKQDSFFRYMTIGSNGTKMPRGNKNFTMKYHIIIPTGNIMVVFSDIAIKLNKWGSILRQQNSLLARQRDLLLPRLMSGKLEVKM